MGVGAGVGVGGGIVIGGGVSIVAVFLVVVCWYSWIGLARYLWRYTLDPL